MSGSALSPDEMRAYQCYSTWLPNVLHYEWLLNDSVISTRPERHHLVIGNLLLINTSLVHNAVIRCVVLLSDGQSMDRHPIALSAGLRVGLQSAKNAAAKWRIRSEPKFVRSGQPTISLFCPIFPGYKLYTWRYQHVGSSRGWLDLDNSESDLLWLKGQVQVLHSTGYLLLSNVTKRFAGVYSCCIRKAHGNKAFCRSFTLKVSGEHKVFCIPFSCIVFPSKAACCAALYL